jgi:hypothetical protein
MKVLVGVSAHSLFWEQLLRQEGIPYRVVDLAEGNAVSEFSVMVVPRLTTGSESEALLGYLRRGGAVMGAARHLPGLPGMKTRREPIEYVVTDGDQVFPTVGLLDLALRGDVPREANHLRTQQNTFAVFAGEISGGIGVVFPFDVAELFFDYRALAKAFYGRRERLPSERVSLVAKGEIQHLVHDALVYLHHARGLPYVHAWYHPGVAKNVLAFRVDTDAGTRPDIDALYRVVRGAGIRATWFLDVRAHEPWIQHFESMVEQEIGVHCYDHVAYTDEEQARYQLGRAKQVVEAVGFAPEGVAAPFGFWTPALARAIEQLGFAYSSEFGYAYDAFPIVGATRDATFAPPQIPVHPVSIGSLLRVGYRPDAMMEYYDRVVRTKLERDEPLFFYHHPGHRCPDVARFLLERAQHEGVMNMTLREYARWWKGRSAAPLFFDIRGSELHVESVSYLNEHGVGLRVLPEGRNEILVPPASVIDLKMLKADRRPAPSFPEDLRRIRETEPRRMLGDLYTAMLRRLR